MAATRKAWAASVTWEKATGRTPSAISRIFCEIGSGCAAMEGRGSRDDSSTAHVRRIVANFKRDKACHPEAGEARRGTSQLQPGLARISEAMTENTSGFA